MSEQAWFVPGRIEVLGKHTDYAGGRSLLCATERGLRLTATRRDDAEVRIVSEGYGATAFVIGSELSPAVGPWSNYPMTVARRLARNFPGPLRGADIHVEGDLPAAAGLGSSTALVVGVFAVLAEVNQLAARPEYAANIRATEDLAGYLGTVEMGGSFGTLAGDAGVGTKGGSQDQTAILCCRPGELAQYSWRPVRHERSVPMPSGWVFAVGVSGVVADKTGGALGRYNRLARAVEGPRETWPMERREQFDAECSEIIPAVADALVKGDVAAVGPLVDRSHALAESCLKNQVPETSALQRTARELGAAAASAFGAGFGGSVWALVRAEGANAFLARWSEAYRSAFPARAADAGFFLTRAGDAIRRL